MSDVIISRRGRGSGKSGNESLITEYIMFNQNWIVPEGVKDNKFDVRIFGAGGTSNTDDYARSGGGSGWMNNDILTLIPGEIINITIGNSVKFDKPNTTISSSEYVINYLSPSPSSFGTYLIANAGGCSSGGYGGNGSAGGGGNYVSGTAYQFGGGGGGQVGGNGGPWGGGRGGGGDGSSARCGDGGDGGIYGGGGGGNGGSNSKTRANGGNGGTYGGGGGIGGGYSGSTPGIGGEYGGNGGKATDLSSVENGTNTIGNLFIPIDLQGAGLKGFYPNNIINNYAGGCGGGGYGGNGGCVHIFNNDKVRCSGGGGGGGYGSNGGNVYNNGKSGGGGGGYGGDGEFIDTTNYFSYATGGGGGYGKTAIGKWGGGGGYYCPGGGYRGQFTPIPGGGGIGIWDNDTLVASYASGGYINYPGEPGICIIKYYI